jgi:hypothetical protein
MSWEFDAAGSSPRYHCRVPDIQRAVCFVGIETSAVHILEQWECFKKFNQRSFNDDFFKLLSAFWE